MQLIIKNNPKKEKFIINKNEKSRVIFNQGYTRDKFLKMFLKN